MQLVGHTKLIFIIWFFFADGSLDFLLGKKNVLCVFFNFTINKVHTLILFGLWFRWECGYRNFLLKGLAHSSALNKYQLCFQFSSAAQSCPTPCNPMDCSSPGLLVHHQLLEFAQTHVHWVGDVIQPSHPLSSPSLPALNLSQHQGLFKWVSSLHQMAKILEFQLQHQSFQWTRRTDLL